MICPIISIIVPVYNTEKYVSRCIDSIMAQTYREWELLLVDDGSTDGSFVICNRYAEKDERIKVYHQENSGASSARNLGIKFSKGDWIAFIDSDDYVSPTYLSDFSTSADISLQGIDENGEKKMKVLDKNYYAERELGHLFFSQRHVYGPVCKLFNRDIITKHNIRFDERLKIGEDFLFVMQYLCCCSSMYVSNVFNYFYCCRSSGTFLSHNVDYNHDCLMFQLHQFWMDKLLFGSKFRRGIMQKHTWGMFLFFIDYYGKDYETLLSDDFFNKASLNYLNPLDRIMLRWKSTRQIHSHIMYQLRKRGIIKV